MHYTLCYGKRDVAISSCHYRFFGRHESRLERCYDKYSRFYDLPTAWSMMFWGILIGGLYGSFGDFILALAIHPRKFLPLLNLIICLMLAVTVHLILRRKKVRRTGSQPTTGWALGLAVGGMVSLFLIFRLLEGNQDNIGLELIASIVLVALISPRAHALVFCRHGYGMLMGKRWSIVLRTFFWTSFF